jgi:hypothetical protein
VLEVTLTGALMQEGREEPTGSAEERALAAEMHFRDALLRARETRESIGQMESAAAQFCREMRRQGHPPERMLRDAKRVIHEAIDGDDGPVAERAVQSCIQHYFRTE